MPVWILLIDEVQEYFELDKETSAEIAELLKWLVKVAPSVGIIVVSSTQKPTGIGQGQIEKDFISFRDQHETKIGLRVASGNVSDVVLGQGARAEGLDLTTLPIEAKGVCILKGAVEHNPVVRTFLADGPAAVRVVEAARRMRRQAGALSGMATGEDVQIEHRDVLADVHAILKTGEDKLTYRLAAARLAERMPQTYADITQDALGQQLRDLGVPREGVRDTETGQSLKGFKLADLDRVSADRGART